VHVWLLSRVQHSQVRVLHQQAMFGIRPIEHLALLVGFKPKVSIWRCRRSRNPALLPLSARIRGRQKMSEKTLLTSTALQPIFPNFLTPKTVHSCQKSMKTNDRPSEGVSTSSSQEIEQRGSSWKLPGLMISRSFGRICYGITVSNSTRSCNLGSVMPKHASHSPPMSRESIHFRRSAFANLATA